MYSKYAFTGRAEILVKLKPMKSFTERLYQALENQLNGVSINQGSECDQLKAAIKLCKKAMSKLRNYVSSYLIENIEDEVYFFRQMKPPFYSKLIYYISIYNFQIKKPTGSDDTVKEYINSELADLKRFFDHNQAFYQYYRSGGNELDHLYFTRGGFDVYAELEDFQGDEMFSTSHDYKLSKIIANEKFQEYLNVQLGRLDRDAAPVNEAQIIWTSNQTDLVELIYALVEAGAFNNGNIDIKNLVMYFQNVFQIDLNHYYHKYTDITNRKKERTVFIDKLKTSLLRRMDDKFELKEPRQRRIGFN